MSSVPFLLHLHLHHMNQLFQGHLVPASVSAACHPLLVSSCGWCPGSFNLSSTGLASTSSSGAIVHSHELQALGPVNGYSAVFLAVPFHPVPSNADGFTAAVSSLRLANDLAKLLQGDMHRAGARFLDQVAHRPEIRRPRLCQRK